MVRADSSTAIHISDNNTIQLCLLTLYFTSYRSAEKRSIADTYLFSVITRQIRASVPQVSQLLSYESIIPYSNEEHAFKSILL